MVNVLQAILPIQWKSQLGNKRNQNEIGFALAWTVGYMEIETFVYNLSKSCPARTTQTP